MGVFGLGRLSFSSFKRSLKTDLNRLSSRLMAPGNPQDPDDQAGALLLLVPEKLQQMAKDGTWKPVALKTAGGLAAVTVATCGLCSQEGVARAAPAQGDAGRVLVVEDDLQAHKRAHLYAEIAPENLAILPAGAPCVGASYTGRGAKKNQKGRSGHSSAQRPSVPPRLSPHGHNRFVRNLGAHRR